MTQAEMNEALHGVKPRNGLRAVSWEESMPFPQNEKTKRMGYFHEWGTFPTPGGLHTMAIVEKPNGETIVIKPGNLNFLTVADPRAQLRPVSYEYLSGGTSREPAFTREEGWYHKVTLDSTYIGEYGVEPRALVESPKGHLRLVDPESIQFLDVGQNQPIDENANSPAASDD